MPDAPNIHRERRLAALLALAVLVADQLTKYMAVDMLGLQQNGPIRINEFFNLVMVWNPGVSFGLLQGHAREVMIAMTGGLTLMLLAWFRRAHEPAVLMGLGAVIGGAIGNIIDRFRWGAVADFLDIHAMGYHWPAFNIADSAIVLGVCVLFLTTITSKSDDDAHA